MIHSSACQQQADTHPALWDEPWPSKLHHSLGHDLADTNIRAIFSFPTTVFSHDENLEKVVDGINSIDWHNHDRDSLGLIYESLLERNATEARAGSGQYFTPRPLVNTMVRLMKPKAGEVISDPAAGTGGFLIAAHRAHVGGIAPEPVYQGIEIERDTFRLCLMNLYLHGMNGYVVHGDALTADSEGLESATLVLANPPFGVSAGGARKRRADLRYPTANKQLSFLQYIAQSLAKGGRAAVVVPDNVLFEPGAGQMIRRDLIEEYDLHTILRLPSGIFYAAGVRTNVLFFNKGPMKQEPRECVWIYDLRNGMPAFTKRKNLVDDDFKEFESAFGDDPHGGSPRVEGPRFKSISKEEIRKRNYDLDIRQADDVADDLPDIADLVLQMDGALAEARTAVTEITAIVSSVGDISAADVHE